VIKQRRDEYKYYFHGNIILHDFVSLKALLSRVQEKNYLPVNSKQFFSEEDFNVLLPPFKNDQEIYFKALIPFFRKILYEAKKIYNIEITKYLSFITELKI
jgi:hypothetical protein